MSKKQLYTDLSGYERLFKLTTHFGDGRHMPEDIQAAYKAIESEKKSLQSISEWLENTLARCQMEHRVGDIKFVSEES